MLGFPPTCKETKAETGSGLHGASGLMTLETKLRCTGLGTGLSGSEKQGAGGKLTDNRWALERDRHERIPGVSEG